MQILQLLIFYYTTLFENKIVFFFTFVIFYRILRTFLQAKKSLLTDIHKTVI